MYPTIEVTSPSGKKFLVNWRNVENTYPANEESIKRGAETLISFSEESSIEVKETYSQIKRLLEAFKIIVTKR